MEKYTLQPLHCWQLDEDPSMLTSARNVRSGQPYMTNAKRENLADIVPGTFPSDAHVETARTA